MYDVVLQCITKMKFESYLLFDSNRSLTAFGHVFLTTTYGRFLSRYERYSTVYITHRAHVFLQPVATRLEHTHTCTHHS
jgi:hypothetical protein